MQMHGLPCSGSAIHHKVIAGSVEIQCFQGIHGNTGWELYFIRAEGRKIMLYGKSCRIYQLCHPCCFTVPDLFTQEIVKILLMAFSGLAQCVINEIC